MDVVIEQEKTNPRKLESPRIHSDLEQLRTLLHFISHDLRSDVGAIQTASELLRSGGNQEKLISLIELVSQRLIRTIDQKYSLAISKLKMVWVLGKFQDKFYLDERTATYFCLFAEFSEMIERLKLYQPDAIVIQKNDAHLLSAIENTAYKRVHWQLVDSVGDLSNLGFVLT